MHAHLVQQVTGGAFLPLVLSYEFGCQLPFIFVQAVGSHIAHAVGDQVVFNLVPNPTSRQNSRDLPPDPLTHGR